MLGAGFGSELELVSLTLGFHFRGETLHSVGLDDSDHRIHILRSHRVIEVLLQEQRDRSSVFRRCRKLFLGLDSLAEGVGACLTACPLPDVDADAKYMK